MTSEQFYYRDGREICLGDYVICNGCLGYIERVWTPNSRGTILNGLPRGSFMIRFFDKSVPTVMEFDHPDVLDLAHAEFGLELKRRATRWFHIRYFWGQCKIFLPCFLRPKVWEFSWWECTWYHFKNTILALFELFQAIVFGAGKNVRQLVEM